MTVSTSLRKCPSLLKLNDTLPDLNVAIVEIFEPVPLPVRNREFRSLLDLGCFSGRGLTEKQLLSLLARCYSCRKFMTRNAFEYHDCPNFIDLTTED